MDDRRGKKGFSEIDREPTLVGEVRVSDKTPDSREDHPASLDAITSFRVFVDDSKGALAFSIRTG